MSSHLLEYSRGQMRVYLLIPSRHVAAFLQGSESIRPPPSHSAGLDTLTCRSRSSRPPGPDTRPPGGGGWKRTRHGPARRTPLLSPRGRYTPAAPGPPGRCPPCCQLLRPLEPRAASKVTPRCPGGTFTHKAPFPWDVHTSGISWTGVGETRVGHIVTALVQVNGSV